MAGGKMTEEERAALGKPINTGKATPEELAQIRDPSLWENIKDIPGSIASGLEKNVSSYPGLPGDMMELLRSLGVVNEKYLEGNDAARIEQIRGEENPFPTTDQVHSALTSNPYEPTTGTGKVVEEIASLLGPRVATRFPELVRDVIAPYIASKLGEKAGESLGPEEQQLLSAGGGLAAGPASEGGKRGAIRAARGPLTPEPGASMRDVQGADVLLAPPGPNARADRVQRLQREGVDVSAGQALGSEFVKRLESGPMNAGGDFNEQQNRQFTRAALRRVGIDAELASPEVLDAAQQQFSRDYEGIVQRSNGVTMDPTLETDLLDIGSSFEDLKGTAQGTAVAKYFNRIVDAAHQHGGVIPADVFQAINGEMAEAIRKSNGAPDLAIMNRALRDMRDTLYDSIARNGQPEIAAQARDLNNRYRNFKIVEDAVGGAGEGVSFGLVSPGKLRAALEARDKSGYRQGQGDFAELARTGQSITPLPTTGTGSQNITSSIVGLGHAAGVYPISKALQSRPVRTSIVNRATGLNPDWIDPLQMPPIIGQSMQDGPAPIEEEPAPEQQGMLLDTMPVPVDPLEAPAQAASAVLPGMLLGLTRASTRV